jgi:hypothetical protein
MSQKQPSLLTQVIIPLVSLAAMSWYLMPAHERKLAMMRGTDLMRRHLDALAKRTGRLSMARELQTGEQTYWLPLMLANWRDKAARKIERLRSIA